MTSAAGSTTTTSPAETTETAVTETLNAEAPASVDWAKESQEQEDEVVETTGATVETVKAEPVKTETAVPVVAAPATTTVAAPVITAAAPATTTVEIAPAVVKTPDQLEAERSTALAAAQAESVKQLTTLTEYYKLPEDLSLKLSTEPENVLPFLAAKIHQSVLQQMSQMVHEALPRAIVGIQDSTTREAKAKEAFYGKWPNLVGRENEVLQVGAMFRRLNANATPEEAIERIGRTVCETLGLTIPTQGNPSAATQTTTTTAAPMFTPAGGSGSGRGGAPTADNLFTKLAEELLIED